ncbi:hypothetical protein PYW08_014099 [Mythimna loreyi]|uniref:Uncharacterized protein n=1 Tax=Mythimna loreyi TaxID=667449 RepID=A0ACC2R6F2_9NEOP|nr:hypothetical protein PYW08_014099 [Mythimna loreyi]
MDSKKSNQYAITVKDVVTSMKNGNAFSLPGLLDMLNTSTEVDVQVKLFSVLSAYLMLNDCKNEVIVTYNPIYDKICKILANCPPRKTTVAFNFLSALLYVDDEESHRKLSIVAYAKNMIRSSGCLATMCDLFSTCMMHQEAWRALCQCLAESCRGVETNQSYCTHLVPMCIQRYNQRNTEVLLVLQSLLQNHNRNITLFMECNGISLFQREQLQHDMCMQLLATIVQSSSEVVALVVKTGICQQLRDFIQTYGPQSQLGQWATIVLYHTSKVEALCERPKLDEVKTENNKQSESFLAKLHPDDQHRQKECSADTTKFFQNVMKEIFQCGAQKEFNNLKTFFPPDIKTNRSPKNTVNNASRVPFHPTPIKKQFCMARQESCNLYGTNIEATEIRNDCKTKELSFSFLRKHTSNNKNAGKAFVTTSKFDESFQRSFQTNESRARKNTVCDTLMEIADSSLITLGTNDFNPQFSSTPKKNDIYKYSRYENKRSYTDNTVKSIEKSVRNHKIKRQLEKKKIAKHLEHSNIDKQIKHKSFSGRFFDAINTSCTTLVKTVKNIFRPKNDLYETKNDADSDSFNKTSKQDTLSCSYSFTDYMRRRDAALKDDCTYKRDGVGVDLKPKTNIEDFSMEMSNSCNTCNNTIALKRKLVSDEHLKQTIRKLKLGINLYGCNFKKISRTMWPKENYMTPTVLYNLYRKLIIK